MKVERKNKAFEPVVITLESLDELHYLWHCLNNLHKEMDFPVELRRDMFLNLDEFYGGIDEVYEDQE